MIRFLSSVGRGARRFALFAALSFPIASAAQEAASASLPATDRVRALLEAHVEAGRGVGFVVGLLDASGERYVTFGARENGKPAPVDPDTVFEIGSVAKAFTGIVLGGEVAAGRLDLAKPVNDVLPAELRLPDGARPITLRDLATHTSGLPRLPAGFAPRDPRNPYAALTIDDLQRSLAGVKLESEAGAVSTYSNLGFMLLSHLLVTRAGKASFEELAREQVFCPLEMAACREGARDMATPHDPQLRPTPMWDIPPTMGGVGALRLSARDLMKLVRANLGDAGPLAPALAEARKEHWAKENRVVGLAWQVRKRGARVFHWHNGATGGSRAFVGFDRASGTGVVVLSNSAHDVTALGMHLLDAEGTPYKVPSKRVAVDPATLAALAGEYEIDGKPALWVMLAAGDRLLARTERGAPQPLEPASPTRFASAGGTLVIERQGDGTPVTVQVTLGGKTSTAVQRPRRPPVALSAAQLAPLAGTYRAGPREFVVAAEGADLVLTVANQKVKLVAESPTEFSVPALTVRVRFEDGKLHWTQLGASVVATRVE